MVQSECIIRSFSAIHGGNKIAVMEDAVLAEPAEREAAPSLSYFFLIVNGFDTRWLRSTLEGPASGGRRRDAYSRKNFRALSWL